MARLKPSIRESETYTEPNFVRVYTAAHGEASGERLATVEHLSYRPKGDGQKPGWNCADRRRRGDVERGRDVHCGQLCNGARRARDLRVPQRLKSSATAGRS